MSHAPNPNPLPLAPLTSFVHGLVHLNSRACLDLIPELPHHTCCSMSNPASEPEFEQAYKGNDKIIVCFIEYVFQDSQNEIWKRTRCLSLHHAGILFSRASCSERLRIPVKLHLSQIISQVEAQVLLWYFPPHN